MALMDKKDVAAFLKCSVSQVENFMKRGQLPYRKFGPKMIRFDPQAVALFAGTTPSQEQVDESGPQSGSYDFTITYGHVRAGGK